MDSEFCIEDVIVSIYGTEMLLKQIRERQIRNCLYNWKYKSQLEKELATQKKKYNKYMLDGFYALARQTQSICMLFHIVKLIEYRQQKYAMDRLVSNAKESMVAATTEDETNIYFNLDEGVNVGSELEPSPSFDEDAAIMIEFQQNLVRFFHGINSVVKIIESNKYRTIYASFHRIKDFSEGRRRETVTEKDGVAKEEVSGGKEVFAPPSPMNKTEARDKENISRNTMWKRHQPLNSGLSLNREELYFEQIPEKKHFYTRKQNVSFNNGSVSHQSCDTEARSSNQSVGLHNQRQQHVFEDLVQQDHVDNFNSQVGGGNVVIGNGIIDFTHANPVLFSSIKSPANSNPMLAIYPHHHSQNLNIVHPIQNRRHPPHFNTNLNYSSQTSTGSLSAPLNTTKYSMSCHASSRNSRPLGQNKTESHQNFAIKRYYSSNDRKSPRSAEITKSILNPCINFTQDSTNLIQNITESFKSVILN